MVLLTWSLPVKLGKSHGVPTVSQVDPFLASDTLMSTEIHINTFEHRNKRLIKNKV